MYFSLFLTSFLFLYHTSVHLPITSSTTVSSRPIVPQSFHLFSPPTTALRLHTFHRFFHSLLLTLRTYVICTSFLPQSCLRFSVPSIPFPTTSPLPCVPLSFPSLPHYLLLYFPLSLPSTYSLTTFSLSSAPLSFPRVHPLPTPLLRYLPSFLPFNYFPSSFRLFIISSLSSFLAAIPPCLPSLHFFCCFI